VVGVNASLSVDPNKSWVVKGKKGIYLRRHEQGHYDIVAIGMREIYNKVCALNKTNCEEVNQEALRIQREVQQQTDAARQRYQTQTGYGANLAVQNNWETQIKTIKLNSNGVLADLPK
jgi:predicted secreted Zn-dependent protease